MPMKITLEERFKKSLLKFGKKNILFRMLAFPVMAVGMFLFHSTAFLRGNVKRLAMLVMTFLLFVVYSSFSFPIFGSGESTGNGLNSVSEEAQDIELAQETEIDLGSIELLSDDEMILEGDDFTEDLNDMEFADRYSADEILAYTQDRERQERDELSENYEFSKDDWRLVLINKQHSIPDDYEVKLGKISTVKGIMKCDERIIDDLRDMLQAAKEDNVTLEIQSPYRTEEYQKYLFNRKINTYMEKGLSYMEAYQLAGLAVNIPGNSEHQIGLALDIVTPTYRKLTEGFADTDAGQWLAKNSYKYGFILRYPKGKEDITNVEYEPWHFRYVGVEAATVITEQGITLEEFWEDL